MDLNKLVARVHRRREDAGRPIVVGISGFGGAGKSTLARALVDALPDAVRMRGDDFLDPQRVHRRSADWDGVERARLVDEVWTRVWGPNERDFAARFAPRDIAEVLMPNP